MLLASHRMCNTAYRGGIQCRLRAMLDLSEMKEEEG